MRFHVLATNALNYSISSCHSFYSYFSLLRAPKSNDSTEKGMYESALRLIVLWYDMEGDHVANVKEQSIGAGIIIHCIHE